MARVTAAVFAALFTCLLLSEIILAKSIPRIPRDVEEDDKISSTSSTSSSKNKICSKSAPCGWSIYVPFTREVVDFMRNACKCAKDHSCDRVDDDLSVSAYVHRCRPKTIPDPEDHLQNVYS